MAWIKTVDETNADGELARTYDELSQRAGAVANILQIHSLAPEVLKAHLDIYHAALHAPGELSRRLLLAQRQFYAAQNTARRLATHCWNGEETDNDKAQSSHQKA